MDKHSENQMVPLSKSAKRARSSPPSTSRLAKRPQLTPAGSKTPGPPGSELHVIDIDSSDDNLSALGQPRMTGATSSRSQPNVIDVESSNDDSDAQVTRFNVLGKAKTPIQVDDVATGRNTWRVSAHNSMAPSDDDDVVCLNGVAPVPSHQVGTPNPTTKASSISRPSPSIQSNQPPLRGRAAYAASSIHTPDRRSLAPQNTAAASPHPFSDNKSTTPKHVISPGSALQRKPPDSLVLPYQNKSRAWATPQPSINKPTPRLSMPSSSLTPAWKPSTPLLAFQNKARASPYSLSDLHHTLQSFASGPPLDRKPSTSQLSAYANIPSAYDNPSFPSTFDVKHTPNDFAPTRPLDPLASLQSLFSGGSYYNPHAEAGESHDFLRQAVQNMDFTHNATVASARKDLGLTRGDDQRLEGLAIQLMAHQIMGVAWMVKQEKSKNMGGILGDEMGLGKTVQMIATMVKNRSTDPKTKATLVLAPLALLNQWKEEIADRSTCDFTVLIYHSSSKPLERKKIADCDVVITTLDTLKRDWNDDEDSDHPKKPRGLFAINWYRVVIDEAQIIRNRKSKRSEAVCSLKSVYRWCLTGTPIFNGLWDIFPYLRFLRLRPYNDVQQFREHIAYWEKKHPNLATQRAQAVLATCMLRRKKDTKLDGKPLIVLPPKHQADVMLEMCPDQREIYDMLEKRAQHKFNAFLRKGTVLKNFACIFVLLLRLRQACGHPFLAMEEAPNSEEYDEFNDPKSELERAITERGQQWVDNLKTTFVTELNELVKAEKEDFNQAAAPECPICTDPLDDTARVTKCGHVFCEACLDNLLMQTQVIEDDRITDPNTIPKPCPNCRSPFSRVDTYLKQAFLPSIDNSLPDDGVLPSSAVEDGDDKKISLGIKSEDKKKMEEIASEFVPSTKIVWLIEEILRVRKQGPTDKIIVVSQWTGMLAICSTFLREQSIRYVSYQGDMNTIERHEAVRTFKTKPEYTIMLMSLKCGGVGLNLTCANRVISLDLAWSPASEKQAFDRTHRFGQEKEVYVSRVILNNTVEQRILDLQRKKQDITDNTLGEGTGKKLKRMTVGELATLFNVNTRGEPLS
ncbi:hypothetical protein PCASD_03707 [Puccinia coronata f. sp. avenae]|uniref:RING-type domain-containing protein n=1 Tax=Puccinia coronata f. sp. avenae TaxID=200324 RepID=A0A2N5V9J2_9BASI|nr:hypothetical protein PCASD_03707 [Puccinia coronata f. sp. avenae]